MAKKLGHWTPAYRGMSRADIRTQSLLDFCALSERGITYGCWHTDSADLPRARNQAVEHAIAREYDYLCMQDADVCAVLTGETQRSPLAQLVEVALEHEALVVGAICELRRGRGELNVSPLHVGEAAEVDAIGSGLILIDVAQLVARASAQSYEGPWFGTTYEDERHTKQESGEDMFFCRLVRALGGSIWADGRIATDHDGRVYDPAQLADRLKPV